MKTCHRHSAPPVATGLRFRCCSCHRHPLPRVPTDGLRGYQRAGQMGIKQVKDAIKLTVLTEFLHPSWIDTSWFAANLWLISRVLKKLILRFFLVFSLLVWRICRGLTLSFPLSCYFSFYNLSVKCLLRCTTCKWLIKNLSWMFLSFIRKRKPFEGIVLTDIFNLGPTTSLYMCTYYVFLFCFFFSFQFLSLLLS